MKVTMRTMALSLLFPAGICFSAIDAAAQDAATFPSLATAKIEAALPNLQIVLVGIGPGRRG